MEPLQESQEIEALLVELRLTEPQLRAYQHLLVHGGAAPTLVARATGQSRGHVYATLRLLVAKGLAQEMPTRPVRFLPTPLREAVAAALAAAQRRLTQLATAQKRLAEAPDLSALAHIRE